MGAKHLSQAKKIQERVLLVATAGTIFKEGEAVCYNRDYGTAADVDGSRSNRVEAPSTSNNRRFAGVLDQSVTIPDCGSVWVEINLPGSVCNIALGANTVIDTAYLTAQAGGGTGAGRFTHKGFPGKGSAIPLQTVTALIESNFAGAWSMATDGKTLTVSDTTGLAAGDTVVIVASENEGATNKYLTPGKYTIDSITNGTVLVLETSAAAGTLTGTITCSGYAYTGNPTALAYLMDGDESGLVEWVSPPNAGGSGLDPMVGGVTYINGGVTLAANTILNLADEVIYGARKGYRTMGTMTTSDVVVDLDTAGFSLNGSTLNEVNAMDAAGDDAFFEWDGKWKALAVVGGSTQA